MGKKTEKAFVREQKQAVPEVTVLYFSQGTGKARDIEKLEMKGEVIVIDHPLEQKEYIRIIKKLSLI